MVVRSAAIDEVSIPLVRRPERCGEKGCLRRTPLSPPFPHVINGSFQKDSDKLGRHFDPLKGHIISRIVKPFCSYLAIGCDKLQYAAKSSYRSYYSHRSYGTLLLFCAPVRNGRYLVTDTPLNLFALIAIHQRSIVVRPNTASTSE